MSSIDYRPDIDGLRTVAVLPVILFHFGATWILGGYFGVDVFFVISGYLITSIIVKETSGNKFSYSNFWFRRVRRIMPALIFMITVILAVGIVVSFPPVTKSYGFDAISSIFSFANFSMLMKFGDYWGAAAESSPFLHTWSLSVEEQFYFIYPFLIVSFSKKRKNLIFILICIIILSFLLFIVSSFISPTLGFFLLPTRAWELASGGLIAVFGVKNLPFKSFSGIISIIGLSLIFLSYFFFTGAEGIGPSAILPVLGSILLIGYASNSIIGDLFSNKIMVFIGKISYSLYLWHWPIIVLAKSLPFSLYFNEIIYLLIQVFFIIFFTLVSYFLVEKPTKFIKPIFSYICVFVFIFFLEFIFIYNVSSKKLYESNFAQTRFYGLYFDVSPFIKEVSNENLMKRRGVYAPASKEQFRDAAFNQGIINDSTHLSSPQIVLVGDSHGATIAKVIGEIGIEMGLSTSFFTMTGNNPFFNIPIAKPFPINQGFSDLEFEKYANNLLKKLTYWKPKILIISCKWTTKINDLDKIEDLVYFAKNLGTKIVFLNQPPIIEGLGENNSNQYFSYLGYKPRNKEVQYIKSNHSKVIAANSKLLKFSEKTGSLYIDIFKEFILDNKIAIIKGDAILYYDDDHISYDGSLIVKNEIKDALLKL